MTDRAYATAADVALDRLRWSAALLTQLVHRGRREGWLRGAVQPDGTLPDAAALHAEIDARIACSPRDISALPMQWLAVRLALDDSSLDLLWLLASIEMSPAVTRLASAFASGTNTDLTVQTVHQLVRITRIELQRLTELGLVEISSDSRLGHHQRWIRASDRVVDIARGEIALDPVISGACELHGADELGSRREDVPVELSRALDGLASPLIVVTGCAGSGRTTLLARAAGRIGKGTLRASTRAFVGDQEQIEGACRALARECELFDVLPLIMGLDAQPAETIAVIETAIGRSFRGPVLVTASRDRRWNTTRPVVSHRMETPSISNRRTIWRTLLSEAAEEVSDVAANRYHTAPGVILAAAANAIARAASPAQVSIEDVHEGLRSHFDDLLGDLATRITVTQHWDDIVLPVDQFEQIAELVARVRHRGHVLETWGFADKVGRGIGLAALLSGPPGTGKTMVAGLIARELGLDLYQVDVSRVVSKYIGETEQNLAKLFDAAESGHAILLFDEADALFAKRSEVKSSNDRYANLEVNYLLQRIEQFRGICLLTTNHETAIDEAFRRRLAIHIRFPVPDEAHRDALWRAVIPERADVGELDFARLAREFAMTGGYIKNAAVRAAYLAADAGASITTDHLWRAARSEYDAMGKLSFGDA